MDNVVASKMWCGGSFKKDNGVLQYFGGECELDSDQLCWFWLEEFDKSCGGEIKIEKIYYLISQYDDLEKGLRRVYSDDEVREMSKITVRDKCVECYVVYEKDELVESPKNRVSKKKPYTPLRNKNTSGTKCDTLFSKDDVENGRTVIRGRGRGSRGGGRSGSVDGGRSGKIGGRGGRAGHGEGGRNGGRASRTTHQIPRGVGVLLDDGGNVLQTGSN
uniref:PB1-like domain-containing protein n=1 Tax=Chenopodium quinoa TaxID=63459 RepID=A0A803N1I6_CHEQI